MARVTVEDCVEKVPNRFELILLASQRARSLDNGATATVSKDNDKNTIIALREIAEETIDLQDVKEKAIDSVVHGKKFASQNDVDQEINVNAMEDEEEYEDGDAEEDIEIEESDDYINEEADLFITEESASEEE